MYNEQELRLQSILLPTAEVCDVEELYFHRNGNEVDFDGYFNFFSLDKWRKYTLIEDLWLHIELSGFSELRIMNDRRETATIPLDPEEKKSYDIEFPYGDQELKRVLWFRLIAPEGSEPDMAGITGYFYTRTDRRHLRAVNIVADICTFKREAYVLRNLRQLKLRILDREDLEVSRHFQIYIVDNGRTLDKHEEISKLIGSLKGRARVFPNKNAGGAGGFTRGMIEAMRAREREGLTHLVIMDDDAIYEPDSLVRLYALLSTIREEWKDTAVGGSVMREDFRYILHESGPSLRDWRIISLKGGNDERRYENAASDYIVKPYGEHDRYSAWCFCCFPFTTIREDNLPIPIFVHYDDVEYGIRNQASGLVTMNGIGVWHKPFGLSVTSMNAYTDTRNKYISMALYQEDLMKGVKGYVNEIAIPIFSYMVRYRYSDAKLIEKAVMDFLKGPEFIMHTDSEKILKDVSALSIRLHPFTEEKDLNKQEISEIEKYISGFDKNSLIDMAYNKRDRKLRLKNFLPLKKYGFKVLPMPLSPYAYFGYRKIAYVEPYTNNVFVGKRSIGKMLGCCMICIRCGIAMHKGRKKAAERYRKAFGEMTSMRFWERYLGID